VAVCICSTCKQQSEVVIHLRHCAHRTAWILVRGFLLDADDRTQPRNLIYLRALHASQEVTHVCRKSLDITSLTFRKNGIESQTRLTATTQSCDNGQTISRDSNIYILEVMNLRTIYLNPFFKFQLSITYNHYHSSYSLYPVNTLIAFLILYFTPSLPVACKFRK